MNPEEMLEQDGFGERELNAFQSRIEAAYRRGVSQALFWVVDHGYDDKEIRKISKEAMDIRFDEAGVVHVSLLHELHNRTVYGKSCRQ